MTPREEYYAELGASTVEALNKRGFEACYCADRKSALDKALSYIAKEQSVTWGGSMSISQIGLIAALHDGNYNYIDRSDAKSNEEKTEMSRKAFFANWYLGSANALSADGKIINIDGTGNRVAAMMYGPDNVLLIVGVNKIAVDEESAIKRARNVAAPINAKRFALSTPCAKTGKCADCLNERCICSYITVTRKCKPQGRIKVIIVGEELGY
jgi:hypothetical protein